MSKFCNQCGKTLEDGEVCTCSAGAPPQGAPQPQYAQQQYAQQQYAQQQYAQQQPPIGVNQQPPQGGPMPVQPPMQYYTQTVTDTYDHTAEFSPKDISDNKVIAMVVYLMGILGVIVALLAATSSPYVAFHLRQELKIIVTNGLVGLITMLLCWTLIVPLAGLIMILVFQVIQIICFFQVCSGKAKEPAIIRGLGFLK